MSKGKTALLRMPVRTAVLALDGDYAGFAVTVRLNAPFGVFRQLASGQEGDMVEALSRLIVDWNLSDEEGTPIPLTPEGIDAVPIDLLKLIMDGVTEAVRFPKENSTP